MTLEDDGNLVFNTTRDFEGKNWDYAVWTETGYEFHSYSSENYDSSNPTAQKGELWITDLGQEAIWPYNSQPPSGWLYKGSGTYLTKDRFNMVELLKNYPNTYQFYMPRTKNSQMVEEAFQKGALDAVYVIAGSTAFVIGGAYILMYAPVAGEFILDNSIKAYAYCYVNVSSYVYGSTLFGGSSYLLGSKTGVLNNNNWVRFGWGYNNNQNVLRFAFGARGINNARTVLSEWGSTLYWINYNGNFIFSQGHIDLLSTPIK